jgi:hypothetical protein
VAANASPQKKVPGAEYHINRGAEGMRATAGAECSSRRRYLPKDLKKFGCGFSDGNARIDTCSTKKEDDHMNAEQRSRWTPWCCYR